MTAGFATVPPIAMLLKTVLAFQVPTGPQFVHVIVLSVVVPPGVWFQAGFPFPVVPNCVVLPVKAFTEIIC